MGRFLPPILSAIALALLLAILPGCVTHGYLLPANQQKVIDRKYVEFPSGAELRQIGADFNAPSGFCFDSDGNIIVVESGADGNEPAIIGFKPDGTRFMIYPVGRKIPFLKTGFIIHGPIGGVAADRGHVYVSHRDADDMGVITAFTYDGSHKTIVAGLPTQGDFGMTDVMVNGNRLYFGVGSATNSGVVGLDNFDWVHKHPKFSDIPYTVVELLGFRFDVKNPDAGMFSPDTKVTAPLSSFGQSNQTTIPAARDGKPTGAIYSVGIDGGELRVEAWGVRNPCGLRVDEYGRIYFTDQGMELRGTRPVKDDPDGLFLLSKTWFGWPDYSRSLLPLSDPRFQPPESMIVTTGYRVLRFLFDHGASGLTSLDKDRDTLLKANFQPLSGAWKFDFGPASGPFKDLRGSVLVALRGDRAPFATGGPKGLSMAGPTGYRIVRVTDPDLPGRTVQDYIRNTALLPLSRGNAPQGLERPIDVKFGPDGNLYFLDYGIVTMKGAMEKVSPHTGRLFKLVGVEPPATK